MKKPSPLTPFSGRRRFALLGLAPVLLAAFFIVFRLLAPVPEVEVSYLEVGQGDSILLRTSEGQVALIDGSYPNGRALKHLQDRGVTHIDLMVLTHRHEDHVGGLAAILRAIPVGLVVTNGQPDDTPEYLDFEAALLETGTEHKVVKKDDKLTFGSLTFQVLSPRKINPTSVNNNSIVLRLEVGKISFLFTGDIMELEENRLVDSRAPINATILKVPHHAADTSSRPVFLETVKAEVAIYSAETGNIHGFPHQITLDNLTIVGSQIYGTDVNGTVTVFTDGRSYSVQVERGEPLNNTD